MLKNTLTVLRGTVAAQALGFLVLPLLTQLFTPETFGQQQLYQTTLGMLLPLAAMRYEIALLRADSDAEFTATLQLCVLINFGMTVVFAFVCAVLASIDGLLSSSTLQVLWFLPLGFMLNGLVQTLGYLPLRHKDYAGVANAKISQAGASVASSISIGVTAPFGGGLIAADLVGRIASIAVLASRHMLFNVTTFRWPYRNDLRQAAIKFHEYPLIAVPGALISYAGSSMTALLMYSAFDLSVSGQYGLVERSLLLPFGMVAFAVSQVFTADLSASLRDGDSQSLVIYRGVVRRMFMLGLLPACLVGLLAPMIFTLVFGPAWALAGELARVIAPLVLVSLVAGSVNSTIVILGWQKVQLGWDLARLAVVLAAWITILRLEVTPLQAMEIHVAVSLVTNTAYLWLADFMLRRRAR